MRNPDRIILILERVMEAWFRHPDMRLSQLLLNLDINYNTEDDELCRKMNDLYFGEDKCM